MVMSLWPHSLWTTLYTIKGLGEESNRSTFARFLPGLGEMRLAGFRHCCWPGRWMKTSSRTCTTTRQNMSLQEGKRAENYDK